MESIGTRIRRARMQMKMTQAELAKALGVGRGAVGNWEGAGNVTPSAVHLIEIAAVTGVDIHWLATGCGNEAERQFLSAYRAASSRQRRLALDQLQFDTEEAME